MSTAKKLAPIPTMGQHRKDAELEAWICERLHLRALFAGVTSTETRRDRLKVVLLERGLTESIAGRRDGKPLTWRGLFKQLYGEDLAA
jgi:hypothetical protein